MPTDDERRRVAAELARRRRLVVGIVVSLVVSLFYFGLVLPLWALALVALAELGVLVAVVVRYRHIVAAVRAQGY